jgi:phage terminase large subunit-like protein
MDQTQALSPKAPPESFFDSYEARRESAKTLLGFALVYLHGYFNEKPASFHAELVRSLADEEIRRLLIIGFRGSGKSIFGSLALPLWAALEHPERYPFIILVADSSRQATLNITSIKHELETNDLIKQDYGQIKGMVVEDFSFQGEGEEWQKQNIVLSNGVRILARSRGQKVRGLRHLQHRPKLVVIDDPEDGEWVRTKENRDKTDRWLHSEIIPGMDVKKGKLVVIGNLLHMDALLSRLKAPGTGFKTLEFPLIDKEGNCTWPAMYPTQKSLQDKERDMGAIPWQREMLLKIVADEDQIIKPEDIHYYDEVPKNAVATIKGHGIDLAISQKENADYTTDVEGDVFYVDAADVSKSGDTPRIFIRPDPFNEHVTFHDFMKRERNIPGERKGAHLFFVEDIGYQKAAVQEMERAMLPVVPMRPTTDKRSRLQVVAPYIKNGTVLFPRTGCEELLGQIFNLGVESHDDLCDGLTTLLQGLVSQGLELPKIQWIEA